MNVEKRAIRRTLREQRRNLPTAFVEEASRAVCARVREFPPYQSCRSLIAYVAHENEVSPALVLAEAGPHRRVYLPHDDAEGGVTLWRSGDPLVVGRCGILQPSRRTPIVIAPPAVALVPLVAWDQNGTRLG